MNSETKICQNCKNQFTIEPEDFEFYDKIKVPAPTFCPECRAIRRWSFRNERSFYKRNCDLCKNSIISVHHNKTPFPVYCSDCWYSDKWDPMEYGWEYDFSKPFFQQNYELQLRVPRLAIIGRDNINSLYINIGVFNKNCYLLIESANNEDCFYGYWLENGCKNAVDSGFLTKVEIAYEALFSWDSYKIFFSKDCKNCLNGVFLLNCVNVSDSFACVNLRNKQYTIFNVPYSKEEYNKKIKSYDLGSYQNLLRFKKEFFEFILKFPRRFSYIINSSNVTGDYIVNSNKLTNAFYCENAENIKNGAHAFSNAKDLMDFDTIALGAELCYESINTGINVSKMKFCMRCWTGHSSEYSDNCDNIQSCFGSISLRNKQYCILNKQYTKEEYEKLVPRIIQHMNEMPYVNKKGRVYKYGEFFPPELSSFSYNETIAQEYFPLTKEQAIKQGYSWKDPEERNIKIDLKTEDLPDHIKDVDDSILGKVIQCGHAPNYGSSTPIDCQEQCATAFKIIEPELEFYKKMNLPLPRLCPNCRHYQRLKQRNPLKLWKRQCQCAGEKSSNGVYQNTIQHSHGTESCPNEFETTYSPDRPEIVYCEQCYQQEVV